MKITKLPEMSGRQVQPDIGWTLSSSHWQVEKVNAKGDVEEKIAYTNFFFAAEAAYEAALLKLPNDRIVFRARARVIRKSWKD